MVRAGKHRDKRNEKKEAQEQQEKVIRRICEMGPPDTWTAGYIDEMWTDVVLFKKEPQDLPPVMRDMTHPSEKIYVIMQCPYVKDFLEEKKWDIQSRLRAIAQENMNEKENDVEDEEKDKTEEGKITDVTEEEAKITDVTEELAEVKIADVPHAEEKGNDPPTDLKEDEQARGA